MTPDMLLTIIVMVVIAMFVIAIVGMWLSYRYSIKTNKNLHSEKHDARVREEDESNDTEHQS